jgi:alpha-glucosidase
MSWDFWPSRRPVRNDALTHPSEVTSLIDLVNSPLQVWSQGLDPTSIAIILLSAVTSSFFVTRYFYRRYLRGDKMARPLFALSSACVLGVFALVQAQSTATTTTTASSTVFTVPADADNGQLVIPNIIDPLAVDPQSVCPGYTASNVLETANGITADLTLAGPACNVYGTDIEALTLTVEYQALDRLHVGIQPKYIGPENATWFLLPEELLQKPGVDTESCSSESDLEFAWTNDPTFAFNVTRKSTGDVLFTTEGSQIVYEDQFIEFGSSLPENYNLYGLGESIHGLRLGNNLTSKLRP